ncbi:PRA1 family protein F2-like [Cornus florida]|uniref:PRA1 family protein F2-like n=1 Tax=Cornus florida TaxID=4283 RepID=UPI0028A14343|nr:PRA1 family protein F2-like [Cornus florida]
MTTYGTIPTSSLPESSQLQFVSRAKEWIRNGLSPRRPWKEMVSMQTITLPADFPDSLSRMRMNVAYFSPNYAIVVVLILFISLLWHPISLIVFVLVMIAWLFLYFLRNEPLVIFGVELDDRMVLTGLSLVTVALLFLTNASVNILVGLLFGVVVVMVHGALRSTNDLFLDAEEGAGSGMVWRGVGDGGGGARLPPIKETVSSST